MTVFRAVCPVAERKSKTMLLSVPKILVPSPAEHLNPDLVLHGPKILIDQYFRWQNVRAKICN